MPIESRLQTKIKQWLKGKGAYSVTIWGGGLQTRGIPDILVCYKSIFVGLELKTDTGRATPEQIENLHRIKEAGGIAMICRSLKEIESVLRLIDEGASIHDIQQTIRLPERRNQSVGRQRSGRTLP